MSTYTLLAVILIIGTLGVVAIYRSEEARRHEHVNQVNTPAYVMATMPDGTQQMVQVPGSAVPGDAPSGGFAVLGFFFPAIGLILWAVWKSQTPLKAHSVGKGALIGAIVGVSLSILTVIIAVVIYIATS